MSQLNELKNKGFSKLRGIFSEDQIKELNNECLKILESKNIIEYPELPKDIILNPMVELYQNDKSRVNFISNRKCSEVTIQIFASFL